MATWACWCVYADDLVVLCATEAAAVESLRRIELILERLHLRVNQEKTRIVDARYGRNGFDFLGFHHRVKESWRWRGRWYMQRWPSVRAMKAIRSKVKGILAARSVLSTTLMERIRALNPVLRGWGQYFGAGNSTGKFAAVDRYVYLRLAIFLRNKHQRRYLGVVGPRLNRRFDALGLYRLTGTVRYARAVHAVG